MNTNATARRCCALFAGAAIGVGLTVVAPAAVGHAARCAGNVTHSDLLTIRDFRMVGYNGTDVIIEAEMVARMSPEAAQTFVDNPGNEGYFILWADDEWDDDEITRWEAHTSYPVVEGLLVRGTTSLAKFQLDEDSAPDPTAFTDEFYIGAHLNDIRNGTHARVQSCNLEIADWGAL